MAHGKSHRAYDVREEGTAFPFFTLLHCTPITLVHSRPKIWKENYIYRLQENVKQRFVTTE